MTDTITSKYEKTIKSQTEYTENNSERLKFAVKEIDTVMKDNISSDINVESLNGLIEYLREHDLIENGVGSTVSVLRTIENSYRTGETMRYNAVTVIDNKIYAFSGTTIYYSEINKGTNKNSMFTKIASIDYIKGASYLLFNNGDGSALLHNDKSTYLKLIDKNTGTLVDTDIKSPSSIKYITSRYIVNYNNKKCDIRTGTLSSISPTASGEVVGVYGDMVFIRGSNSYNIINLTTDTAVEISYDKSFDSKSYLIFNNGDYMYIDNTSNKNKSIRKLSGHTLVAELLKGSAFEVGSKGAWTIRKVVEGRDGVAILSSSSDGSTDGYGTYGSSVNVLNKSTGSVDLILDGANKKYYDGYGGVRFLLDNAQGVLLCYEEIETSLTNDIFPSYLMKI